MISDNDIDQNCKDLQTYACNKGLIKISMPNLGNQGRLIKTHFNLLFLLCYQKLSIYKTWIYSGYNASLYSYWNL